MSINYEIAMEMQKICTGESRELTRGQIASEVIDIEKEVKCFNKEKEKNCREFYEKLVADSSKKVYDVEMLLEETDSIKEEFSNFLKSNNDEDSFQKAFDSISDFFMTPPFEGLDSVEYGVNEVCVFSILEYFIMKTAEKHNHEKMRSDYRQSIADRTYVEVADHWIEVYDNLQKRYDKIVENFCGDRAEDYKLAACAIVAIAAIRDQDEFALDMAQSSAQQKGKDIIDEYLEGDYKDGESTFTDNVIKLYEFIKGYLRG